MIVHNIEQGTPEWHKARCGVFTASTFKDILTPKTQQLSKSAQQLENQIIAEILTGDPIEDEESFGGSKWTERGKMLEPRARAAYEMMTGDTVDKIGFATNDERTIGGSPDGLVGMHGGLEIKCLKPKNHVALHRTKELDEEHKPQIQGLMMIFERKWWDVLGYHPKMPPVLIRVERDVLYIAKLKTALNQMVKNVAEAVAEMRELSK